MVKILIKKIKIMGALNKLEFGRYSIITNSNLFLCFCLYLYPSPLSHLQRWFGLPNIIAKAAYYFWIESKLTTNYFTKISIYLNILF